MKKGPLILSILLTGAVLILLFVLVSTYKRTTEAAVPAEAAEDLSQYEFQFQPPVAALSSPNPADTPMSGTVRIFDAAVEAAKVMGHNDVYLTEYAQLNGTDVYLVTFLSGDLVYVSLDGQVVSTSKTNPVDPYEPTSHR